MNDYKSLSHTKWDCRYHVVFIPKYRRKTLYVELRRHLEEVFLSCRCKRKGHLMADHVHMMISISPKYAVSQVIGYQRQERELEQEKLDQMRSRNTVDYCLGNSFG